jgi:hypothetical protein
MEYLSEDIIRNINTDHTKEVDDEMKRLWHRKRIALQGHFTRRKNILIRLIISTMYGSVDPNEATNFDYSTTTREQLNKAKTDLDDSYEKLGRLYDRINELNIEDAAHADSKAFATIIASTEAAYDQIERTFGVLKYKLIQQQVPQPHVAEAQIKPVTALKPSFELTFEHNPTELESWIQQYTSYHNASKMDRLPIPEAQAFLRQGVDTSVWTSIQEDVNDQVGVLQNPNHRNDVTCISLIRRQFQIKYPLIMRRYKFMTYTRTGTQTFTDFFSNLKNLAQAAQMEEMTQNDYLIYRIICGINHKESMDKLLSIPQDNFNLEEIRRMAESMEAAQNYKQAITPNKAERETTSCNATSTTNYQRQKRQNWTNKHSPESTNNDAKSTIFDKLLKENKCFRCGKPKHQVGETCPNINTVCRNCQTPGHLAAVCGKPPKQHNTRHTTNYTSQNADPDHIEHRATTHHTNYDPNTE